MRLLILTKNEFYNQTPSEFVAITLSDYAIQSSVVLTVVPAQLDRALYTPKYGSYEFNCNFGHNLHKICAELVQIISHVDFVVTPYSHELINILKGARGVGKAVDLKRKFLDVTTDFEPGYIKFDKNALEVSIDLIEFLLRIDIGILLSNQAARLARAA